jgi:DNA replication and repair protein RecF
VQLRQLVARGYRNLEDIECETPSKGMVFLGRNAQGKTNLLEAIYYPVLFRSFRGSSDQEVAGGPAGFHVELQLAGAAVAGVAATYAGRKKRITVGGAEVSRLSDAVGAWLAVAFLPSDVGLASGPASERRQYVDRLLSLSDSRYLRALTVYRAAIAQRNSALRQGRVGVAQAFDGTLAGAGSELVRKRLAWLVRAREQFAAEFECLGESSSATLEYRGAPELAEASAWPGALSSALPEDRARSMTTVGPHRDDVLLGIGGRRLRSFGSTGQQRSAAIALKLLEMATLRDARGTEPALLLDDVFAELDRERQSRLAVRLMGPTERQVFVTSPRLDELPSNLDLPVWVVGAGRVSRKDYEL